jgi:transcriptional regulator of acetoin/glycerol metabolism
MNGRVMSVKNKTGFAVESLWLKVIISRPGTLKQARDEAELAEIHHALARHDYNITHASQDLDISRPTLHDLIKKHGIVVQK